MKLFLNVPIEGSPTGTVSARISDYLRHKLYFSERFDEDDPESKLEFYVREAMTALAIVQCLLAEHPDLSDEICEAEGEMRGDIEHYREHSRTEAARQLVKEVRARNGRQGNAKARRRKDTARSRKRNPRTARPSKPVSRTQLSRKGRQAIARVARERWAHWKEQQLKQRRGGE